MPDHPQVRRRFATLASNRPLCPGAEAPGYLPGSLRDLLRIHSLILPLVLSASPPLTATEPWHIEGTTRWRLASPTPGTHPGFSVIPSTARLGIAFTNHVSTAAALNNQILENGAGVALGDVDGDGLCDVYLCGSEPSNSLFRNLGNWRFSNITPSAGVACEGQFSTGAAFADIDGDDDLDLLVNGLGVGTRVFRNDGSGRFTEDNASGLDRRSAATSLALADSDGDGDLDLYVARYRVISARSEVPPPALSARRVADQLVITPSQRFRGFLLADGRIEIAEKGEADSFLLNDGSGRFQPVSWTNGTFLDESGQRLVEPPQDWSLSVLFRDLTGDGHPDLYVCNDFFRSRDQFWINDGQRRFRAADALAWRNMSLSSMAADAADLDRDGYDDFLVVEMLSREHATRHRQRANAFRPEQAIPFSDPLYRPELPRNTLFHARGDGSFAEIALFAGLAATDWSWNVAFLDIDLDGFEDVLLATGNPHDVLDLDAQNALDRANPQGNIPALAFYPPLPQAPLAFRNQGDLTFTNLSEAWGLSSPGFAHGLALADLDNDGDLDVVMNRLHQAVLLLQNNASTPRLSVRLRGIPPNTRGVGARIRVRGGPVPQSQVITAGGRYLSSDDTIRTFAASSADVPLAIEILWRSGRISHVTNALPNRLYEITEPSTPVPPASRTSEPTPSPTPLFKDASTLLAHRHSDPSAPDFSLQPLLPRALNHPGPAVAWIDMDKDGWDDVVLVSGPGRSPEVFRNHGGTSFKLHVPSSGSTSVFPPPIPPLAFSVASRTHPHPAAVALADVDADGDLDVFVGGGEIPGRFPEAALSQLMLNQNGNLEPDPSQVDLRGSIGLVRAAVFTDLDRDGAPDLALACEWGPLRVFFNRNGRFEEATRPLGLEKWTGCWSGLAALDADENGQIDLVASNLGRNTRHQIPGPSPWRLYAADFDLNGTLEIIETFRPPGFSHFAPWRTLDVLAPHVPAWQARYPTYRAFGTTTVDPMFEGLATNIFFVEARTFEHRLFLNRGTHFESRPLPPPAQFAPAFAIAVADFNGDSHEDLFLAQNGFDLDLDSGRADAGTGLCLLGDGRGAFRALSPVESGIALHGQQRAAAVADFDRDGRPDVCVTQHNGTTALLRNTAGTPGTRLHLQGPAGNPHSIGAVLRRLDAGQPIGPIREIRSGSGYFSADSPSLIFPRLDRTWELDVMWPDRRRTRHKIPANASESTLSWEP